MSYAAYPQTFTKEGVPDCCSIPCGNRPEFLMEKFFGEEKFHSIVLRRSLSEKAKEKSSRRQPIRCKVVKKRENSLQTLFSLVLQEKQLN